MTNLAAGWIVRVREWGDPDEFYVAAITNSREAEEQVREAARPGPRAQVKALRELSEEEIDFHKLEPGKIARAPSRHGA